MFLKVGSIIYLSKLKLAVVLNRNVLVNGNIEMIKVKMSERQTKAGNQISLTLSHSLTLSLSHSFTLSLSSPPLAGVAEMAEAEVTGAESEESGSNRSAGSVP